MAQGIVRGLTPEVIDDIFTYHAPTPDQIPKYEAIRDGAKAFAQILIANSPGSPDQSAALRSLRLAVYQANSAIANGGK